jgi:6-phosphogluconate dehydrogenase
VIAVSVIAISAIASSPIGHRVIGYRPIGRRSIGPSLHRTIAPSGDRAIGPSAHRFTVIALSAQDPVIAAEHSAVTRTVIVQYLQIMQLGLIGLGRMGQGLAHRLMRDGHAVVGYDLAPANVAALGAAGGTGAESLDALVAALSPPRAVWVMVPHGEPTRTTVAALLERLTPGDVLADGGNSLYLESVQHATQAAARGIQFLDIGVSGGVWGVESGFNLMIGGSAEAYARLAPVFHSLAPPGGVARVGSSGAGHFVKMIHNAIEYAMLQAIGEGFECLRRSEFDLDLAQVARLWQEGAVVRSWLLELLGRALAQDGDALDRIDDHIDDSGTGRWTIEYAVANGIPVPAISTALYERFDSRLPRRFAHQVIAALRQQFGGHAVQERQS